MNELFRKSYTTKSLATGTTQISYEKASKVLADAICHEIPITLLDAERIDISKVVNPKCKGIIAAFKTLYNHPNNQPNNKQVSDEVWQSMIDTGFCDKDAKCEADSIENLTGRKREPDVMSVAQAINTLAYLDIAPNERSLFTFLNDYEGYDTEYSYLIKNYLPTSALGMIYGDSGSYKTFHVLSWGVHVALGKSWNGCQVNKTGVLFVAGEGGIGVPRRIKALADKYNSGEPIKNLYRLDHAISFGDYHQVETLIESIKSYVEKDGQSFGLVIIDTLARCFSGDENKTEDMGRFVAACDRLKAIVGVTVLVVHHSGVADKKRARGSSSLRAACDFEFRVERAKLEPPALILTSTKTKDDKEKPTQMFSLSSVELFIDSDGDPVVSLAASNFGEEPPTEYECLDIKLKPNEQMVYQVVRSRQQQNDITTRKVIRDDLRAQGTNISNFSHWLKGCLDKGALIENEGVLVAITNH